MSIKIVLADDHVIMREGLHSLLEKEPDMEVVADAENGRMAVQLACKLTPDVIIMDVSMPDLNGMEATRQIVTQCPGVKVLALSMHLNRQFVAKMLKAGAHGYLLKEGAFKELSAAIRVVAANQVYLSPKVASTVIADYLRQMPDDESPVGPPLTAREREVVQLLAEGATTKQIAFRLHVSINTVETHRRQIMNKLNIRSIAELTKYAIREGLTSLD